MRLPDRVTTQVPSLGRYDVGLPGRMYRAQRTAIDAFQGAMDTFGQIGIQIYQQNAAAEHSKLRTEYMDRMNTAQASLESQPYREVLDDQGNSTGELVSRHTEILNETAEAEKRIRDEILAKSTNSLAYRRLTEDLNQGGLAYRERARTTAANWAVADASRNFRTSFRTNIANNNFKAAEQDLVTAVKVGAVSPADQNRFATEILAKRQYRTGELLIEGISAETHTIEQVHELHRVFDEGENYVHLTDSQKASLHSALNYKVSDMMVEDVTFTINHFSLEDGESAIRAYMDRRWDKSGFSDIRSYNAAIGQLWNVYNQRAARNQKTQKEIDTNNRVLEILAGGRADPTLAIDKTAMDIVFDIRVAEAGVREGSPEWVRIAGQQMRTQGWFPPKVKSYVVAGLIHDDPASVIGAAQIVKYADRHAGRSLDWISKEQIATAHMINMLSENGVQDAEAFMKVREGIERLDEATIQAREAAYTAFPKDGLYKSLEEQVAAYDPDWFSTAEIKQEMVERYDYLRKTNYLLTGNKQIAENMAFNELIGTYGIVRRSGDKIMERKPPEAILTDAPPDKVREYVEDEWSQLVEALDADLEDLVAVYKLDNSARHSWYVYNIAEGQVVTDENGMVLKWRPSYMTSRVGKRDQLKAQQDRISELIEVERERLDYDAKMGLYEMKPDEMSPTQRIKHDINLMGDVVSSDVRKAGKGMGEFFTEDVPEWWIGTWSASRERGKDEARAREQIYQKHERMRDEIQAQPGSKLDQYQKQLRVINQELEKLE